MKQADLLWSAILDPASAASLDAAAWDRLVPLARQARLLARLAVLLREQGCAGQLPAKVREHLDAACAVAEKHGTTIRWEASRVARALGPLGVPVILLKGAAYLLAGLPPARGRLLSDLDIMVPKADLKRVEQALAEHGWRTLKLHPYDQRYYRRWMHELPPMIHALRGTVLDVHHTILPESGRLHPDAGKLFAAAVPLENAPLGVLAPADMVLHSAAHLFQDGDLAGGLRDLIDLDDLLRHFGQAQGFWDGLVPRARELHLARPLYYALRYCGRFLGTPIPAPVLDAARAGQPRWPVGPLMDALVSRAIRPEPAERRRLGGGAARWLLYVRSHWLRMPPGLLTSHLVRKALRRWYAESEPQPATAIRADNTEGTRHDDAPGA